MALKRFFSVRFVIGLIFLANPVISLFDVLPDFIGFLLLFSALTEIAFLDERLETARRMTLYGAAVSGARTVLMFFAFDMDENWILSLVSLLGVAELFAAIYFSVSFFGGISYIAQRCESESVLGNVDKLKRIWIAFWLVHTFSTILPELAALPQLTLQHDPYAYPNLSERLLLLYKNGAVMILFAVSLITGIWWFIKTASFLKGVRNDEKLKASLGVRYEGFLKANPLQETFLACRLACVLFTVGCALQMNLALDGVYVIPAWAGTIFLAVGLYRLGVKKLKSYALIAVAFAVQLFCAFARVEGAAKYAVPPLLALSCFGAVFMAERLFTERVKAMLSYDLEGGFMLARIPFAVFLICRCVYGVYPNYWFHFASIVGFTVWMVIIIWICSSLMSEIKHRRRL